MVKSQEIGKIMGTCRHFVGVGCEPCGAGVNVREHVGGDDLGWACRIPCVRPSANAFIRADEVVPCDRFDAPSSAEAEAEVAEVDALIERMEKLGPVVQELKKEHAGKGYQGVLECPLCGGRLHVSIAAINGHVWLRCESDGCVRIQE